MATQYRKAYVSVTLDVDKEGAILPRLIWWDNGVIFQIEQILYKCRATAKKVGGGGIRYTCLLYTSGYDPDRIHPFLPGYFPRPFKFPRCGLAGTAVGLSLIHI